MWTYIYNLWYKKCGLIVTLGWCEIIFFLSLMTPRMSANQLRIISLGFMDLSKPFAVILILNQFITNSKLTNYGTKKVYNLILWPYSSNRYQKPIFLRKNSNVSQWYIICCYNIKKISIVFDIQSLIIKRLQDFSTKWIKTITEFVISSSFCDVTNKYARPFRYSII